MRVLFVCYGNVCRSPLAEALYLDKISKLGLAAQFHADSAGTGFLRFGEPPNRHMLRILRGLNIETTHRSRQITSDDLDHFDYILTMDDDVYRAVCSLGKSRAKVQPILKYAPGAGYDQVPDPMKTRNFDEVYAIVDKAVDGFVAATYQATS